MRFKKEKILKILIGIILVISLSANLILLTGRAVVIRKEDYEEYKKLSKLVTLKKFIQENYYTQVDEQKLIDSALKGLFEGLDDPYSQYLNEKEFKSLMEYTKGTYSGIGIIVTPGEDGFITIVSPIEDTPGFRAGLKAGDKILKVDDKEVTAKEIDKAISMMKGPEGTNVKLTILRDEKEMSLNIKREEIRLKTVRSEVLEENIGYIRITTFDEKTAQDFKQNLQSLQSQGIKGLIIDLRGNPGGLLDQCKEIADEILGKGTIVYTKDNKGKKEYLKSDGRQIDIPLVVLIDEGSASASEILAGAIRDHKAGTLIGTTTFGKGLVQRVRPLNDGSGFKLTISQYFTPNGEYIHGKGIQPNIVVEDEQEQLKKAIEHLKGKMK
ncbi:carboxyl-terminal processing protease [Alkalithermobacter thermoalcaliphilus JW-YL-7 = DSM 7308]|uniref:Carboxyl-terminal processing protease n=1 Tax=Alkalithermobacter thermoalcaliphilus JW-YL-7 = DSM 7308 TaxID=1121328 RepID=A0A150FTJ1_CLOPD|nr:carboxyl-terminal protease [[Clostridium] paradoxum JW-YL-7 = DSM 7308]SHK72965.1 carboxyl-terminal processing protease [[Clostridium] paradoxum JW-YL-7 = DSM 7308]